MEKNEKLSTVDFISSLLVRYKILLIVITLVIAVSLIGLAVGAVVTNASTEKNAALEEKRYLNSLTEKELLLEIQIINKGYQDAFVHASDQGVEITVVSSEHSVKAANEIIVMAMGGFDKVFDNVSVQFQTTEEVMGKVTSK